MIQAGYKVVAKRFPPIIDAVKAEGIKFALEVHPTEIAFDIASAQRALKAVGNHKAFGFNYDPSHLGYQGVDYVKFIRTFPDRIFHTLRQAGEPRPGLLGLPGGSQRAPEAAWAVTALLTVFYAGQRGSSPGHG